MNGSRDCDGADRRWARACKRIGPVASLVCMAANADSALSVADLPLILALSRERTLAGAAERLDVDLSTVFRRLNALEKRLRRAPVRSFRAGLSASRSRANAPPAPPSASRPSCWRSTATSAAATSSCPGVLRVTASETLSHAVLPRLLRASSTRAHPRIQLDAHHRQPHAWISARREAERRRCACAGPPIRPLFGRRLTGIALGVLRPCGPPAPPAPRRRRRSTSRRHSVIGWDEPCAHRRERLDRRATSRPDRIGYPQQQPREPARGARSELGHRAAALLSRAIRDDRTCAAFPACCRTSRSELWIVTHQDLKNTGAHPRVPRGDRRRHRRARRSFEGQT